MKKIALAAAASISFSAMAHATTTIQTIGNQTYINTYGSGGYSSTVCTTIGTTVYCN
jgi:hypothetical protein